MLRLFSLLLVLVMGAPAALAQRPTADGFDTEAIARAFLAGDAARVADLFTEDARLYALSNEFASGRDEILAYYQSLFDVHGGADLEIQPEEAIEMGAYLYTQGTYTSPDPAAERARYGWTGLSKRVDGEWRIHRLTIYPAEMTEF